MSRDCVKASATPSQKHGLSRPYISLFFFVFFLFLVFFLDILDGQKGKPKLAQVAPGLSRKRALA